MIIKGEKKDETALKDDAAIYSRRERKSEKQKFSELHGKEKFQYFKDYYLKAVIISVIVLALIASFVYSMVKGKPEDILYVAVVDNPFTEDIINEMTAEMESRLIEDEEKQKVSIDSSYFMSGDSGYYSSMKLMALMSARDIDVMIMPMNEFKNQVNGGAIATLDTFMDGQDLARWQDYIVNVTPEDVDISTEEVTYGVPGDYGLIINPYLEKHGYDLTKASATYVMAFLVNTENPESCREFARYIFE